MQSRDTEVGIVGSGPAALMAAEVISAAGYRVTVFEKRMRAGRKLLVAGSSGLNITNRMCLREFSEFSKQYTGPSAIWRSAFETFPATAWIEYINKLGFKTFEGTSDRYFIEDMKASKLLAAWVNRLQGQGVQFEFGQDCVSFAKNEEVSSCSLGFASGEHRAFQAICFALGGGSWESNEKPLRWPRLFKDRGVHFVDFTPSNVGYGVDWSKAFLTEVGRQPLKNVILHTARGQRHGDILITEYGIEGTPVYHVGTRGPAHLDLKPDLTAKQIAHKLKLVKENLSPLRRAKRQLNLGPAALALLFHMCPPEIGFNSLELSDVAHMIKYFPLTLNEPRPLEEAISSCGGLSFSELTDSLMLKKFPGIFAAGEMLDWDAPTGGFLIQGCVSQGYLAGMSIVRYLIETGSSTGARCSRAR